MRMVDVIPKHVTNQENSLTIVPFYRVIFPLLAEQAIRPILAHDVDLTLRRIFVCTRLAPSPVNSLFAAVSGQAIHPIECRHVRARVPSAAKLLPRCVHD